MERKLPAFVSPQKLLLLGCHSRAFPCEAPSHSWKIQGPYRLSRVSQKMFLNPFLPHLLILGIVQILCFWTSSLHLSMFLACPNLHAVSAFSQISFPNECCPIFYNGIHTCTNTLNISFSENVISIVEEKENNIKEKKQNFVSTVAVKI